MSVNNSLVSNTKLNVLIWRTEWLSYSETFIELQARNLRKSRPIFAGLSVNDTGRQLGATSVIPQSTSLGRLGRLLLSRLGLSPGLSSLIGSENVQIVHAHFGPDAVSIWRFCRRNSVPLVLTLHGYDVSSMATGSDFRTVKYRRKLKAAMNYASTVICVSEHIRNLAVELGSPADRTIVHHIGVEIPPASSVVRNREGLVFVGRLVEKKGLDDLLAALALLPHDLRRTNLTVIGQGPLLKEMRAHAEFLGLSVDFRGALPHSEVLDAIASASVVVVPSRQASGGDVEGLPTVVMEAMSRGVPVVGTRHSGIPEAVRHGYEGLLSDEGDIEGLAANLKRLLQDAGDLDSMGRSARARAADMFDISFQSAALDSIYASAAVR